MCCSQGRVAASASTEAASVANPTFIRKKTKVTRAVSIKAMPALIKPWRSRAMPHMRTTGPAIIGGTVRPDVPQRRVAKPVNAKKAPNVAIIRAVPEARRNGVIARI